MAAMITIKGVQVPGSRSILGRLRENNRSNTSPETLKKVEQLQQLLTKAINHPGISEKAKQGNFAFFANVALGGRDQDAAAALGRTDRAIERKFSTLSERLSNIKISKSLLGAIAYACGVITLEDILRVAQIELPKASPATS